MTYIYIRTIHIQKANNIARLEQEQDNQKNDYHSFNV